MNVSYVASKKEGWNMNWRILLLVLVMLFVGISAPADADVLCSNPSGSVFVRTQCKANERQLDPVALGLVEPQGLMLARMNAIPHTFDLEVTYGAPSGISTANASENSVSMVSPNTTLIATDLAVSLTVEVNSNSARRFTLRVNGSDTVLSCTMGSFGSSCTSSAAVTVPPQSLLSIKSDRPGTPFNSFPREARIVFRLTE